VESFVYPGACNSLESGQGTREILMLVLDLKQVGIDSSQIACGLVC